MRASPAGLTDEPRPLRERLSQEKESFTSFRIRTVNFRDPQNTARGFTGDPLPPSTGIGANVSMNS
jgi:hypothetical protein